MTMKINPEWEALENKPHGSILLNADSCKSINVGPPPKDMSKKIIRINASALKQSACFLNFYYTVIEGYKQPINSVSIEFGSAVHLFLKVMYKSGGRFDEAVLAARTYFETTKMEVDYKKKYLDTMHLLSVCIKYWTYLQETDDFQMMMLEEKNCSLCVDGSVDKILQGGNDIQEALCPRCKGTTVISECASEVTFSNLYFEDENYQVFLEGTIDRIGKFKGNGCYGIGDFKTTAAYDKKEYLRLYELSPQLKFYYFNLKLLGERNPDSLIGQITKLPVGCFIDGIFLNGAEKIEFMRSDIFLFSPDVMDEFTILLNSTIQRLINTLDANEIPIAEGKINGACTTTWGTCKFFNACAAFDERDKMHILKNHFLKEEYQPLKRSDD